MNELHFLVGWLVGVLRDHYRSFFWSQNKAFPYCALISFWKAGVRANALGEESTIIWVPSPALWQFLETSGSLRSQHPSTECQGQRWHQGTTGALPPTPGLPHLRYTQVYHLSSPSNQWGHPHPVARPCWTEVQEGNCTCVGEGTFGALLDVWPRIPWGIHLSLAFPPCPLSWRRDGGERQALQVGARWCHDTPGAEIR